LNEKTSDTRKAPEGRRELSGGVMSAIDFDMAIERVANPTGDRVKITM
jgi:cyanate lyase